MKFIHLSDLHLGKRVNEVSMLEDQQYILSSVIRIVDGEKPEAVLIAGDVFDKSIPPAEAVTLFDDFLYRLSKRNAAIFIISGNHDSAERLAFGGRLMNRAGIHVSPVYDGNIDSIELYDEYGVVKFWLMPFVKPANVRRFFPESEIDSYTDALRLVIEKMEIGKQERNVLVTHQFVTGAIRCESEEISVGGTDSVDSAVFSDFDYVALGHLHGPQNVGSERIRYCGTPLKYSFSELKHEKSVTVAELGEKNSLRIYTVPLIPKHDMRALKGSYNELTKKSFYEGTAVDDYLHITLTDEDDVPEAVGRLRAIYPNILKLSYDNTRTRNNNEICDVLDVQYKSPLELFEEFYELQNNQPMDENQRKLSREIIENIWEKNV